jgi:cytochrome c-type biogenesis protein
VGLVEYAVAAGGGVVSFLSPCVLPLVPVYLSVATGLGVPELRAGGRAEDRPGGAPGKPSHAAAVLRGSGLFVAGFSAVFVALGSSATAVGNLLARHQVPLTRVGGALVICLGVLLLTGTWWVGGPLARDLRWHPRALPWRTWGPPLSGAAFAFGWTPCIGPVLGSVLTVAAQQDRAAQGGALLLSYSLGLGVPFVLTGLAFSRGLHALRWARGHSQLLVRGSALVLTGYGVLLALDGLPWMTTHLQQAALAAHLGRLLTLG